MKIIVLQNSREVASGLKPKLVTGADSAILRMGEPVFLPASDMPMRSMIAPAIRIGRLGLNIPADAADQYIDGYTLFHLLLPDGDDFDMNLWGMSDRTFSPGVWTAEAFGRKETPECVRIEVSDLYGRQETTIDEKYSPEIPAALCSEAVSALSQYSTMKTGDIIVLTDLAHPPVAATANTTVRVWLNDTQVLNFRIK